MLRAEIDALVKRCYDSMRCVLLPKFINLALQNMSLHCHETLEHSDFELTMENSQFKEQVQNYEFELLKMFFQFQARR